MTKFDDFDLLCDDEYPAPPYYRVHSMAGEFLGEVLCDGIIYFWRRLGEIEWEREYRLHDCLDHLIQGVSHSNEKPLS